MSAFLDRDPQFPLDVLACAEPWGRALQPACTSLLGAASSAQHRSCAWGFVMHNSCSAL